MSADFFSELGSIFDDIIEVVSDGIDYAIEQVTKFVDYVRTEHFQEAAHFFLDAVEATASALEYVAPIVETMTGIPASGIVDVAKSVVEIGRFVVDMLNDKPNVPLEDWLPLAGHLIAAGAHFGLGHSKAGARSTGRAVEAFRQITEDYPETAAQYPVPSNILALSLRDEFKAVSVSDLDALVVVPG